MNTSNKLYLVAAALWLIAATLQAATGNVGLALLNGSLVALYSFLAFRS